MRAGTLVLAAAVLLAACQLDADGKIEIKDAWAPATPPGATVAAVYMEIAANEPDTLISATTSAATKVEMHVSREAGGMMQMRPLETVEMTAGQRLRFEPSGAHFMLIGLRAQLTAGSQFPLTLRFQNAADVIVEVNVRAVGADATSH